MSWFLVFALTCVLALVLYRYIAVRGIISDIHKDLTKKEGEFNTLTYDYERLENMYNEMVDTAVDLGYIVKTARGHMWWRPSMAKGYKPQLITENGEKVNETKA